MQWFLSKFYWAHTPFSVDLSLYRDESQLQKSKRAVKRRRSPSQKSSSPKRGKRSKKTKEPSGPSGSKPAKTNAPSKAKPPARKPPAKRVANPPVVEKVLLVCNGPDSRLCVDKYYRFRGTARPIGCKVHFKWNGRTRTISLAVESPIHQSQFQFLNRKVSSASD